MAFRKTASSYLEIEMQQIAATYGFSPKVLAINDLDFDMVNLDSPCLADVYGDDPTKIPDWIWEEIHHILTVLYECEGIEYVDITPYNFIEKEAKLWIIDFGHAYYTQSPVVPENWFLRDFLDGERGWNPDFA